MFVFCYCAMLFSLDKKFDDDVGVVQMTRSLVQMSGIWIWGEIKTDTGN